jgi:TusA-related sulfurtransferase
MKKGTHIKPDLVVDARGTACPGPLLSAQKAMKEIQSGQILEILSSDKKTKQDVPNWASARGHEYLGTDESSGYFSVFIKKGHKL